MADVTIRDLDDDDVLERVRERAQRRHRALEAELRAPISRGVEPADIEAFKAAAEIRARPTGRRQGDSTDLVRAARDWAQAATTMVTITIRHRDELVVEKPKARGIAHERSLAAAPRAVLAREAERATRTGLRAAADHLARAGTRPGARSDGTDLVREDRER